MVFQAKGLPGNCELQNTSWRTKKYGQEISPNGVFGVSHLQGGRVGFQWIKDCGPSGDSLYILDSIGSISPYQRCLVPKRMVAARFKDAGTCLQPRPINISVKFQCFLRLIQYILMVDLELGFNYKALPLSSGKTPTCSYMRKEIFVFDEIYH